MKLRILLLAAAALLFVGTTAYDAHMVAKELAGRHSAKALDRRIDDLNREIRSEMAETNSHAVDQSPTTGTKKSGTRKADAFNPKQLIGSDAGLRQKYLDFYRGGLDVQYGLLFRLLGLSPDTVEKLKAILAEDEDHSLMVAGQAADEGLAVDDPAMKALLSQLNRPQWQEIRQLLGPDGAASLRQYWREWPAVSVLREFTGNLPATDLTVPQAEQLLPILSAASQKDSNGTLIPDTVDIGQVATAAAPLLTDEQLLTLTAVLQKNQAEAELARLKSGN